MTTRKVLNKKPYEGKLLVRFDDGEVASAAMSKRGALHYKRLRPIFITIQTCRAMMAKIIFVIAVLMVSNAWAYYGTQIANGVKWYYNRVSDGNGGYTAEITYKDKNYNSYTLSNITIPEKLGEYTVTSISPVAFYGCSSIRKITIPETVTQIG